MENTPDETPKPTEDKNEIKIVSNVLKDIQKKLAILQPTECAEELASIDELQTIVEKLVAISTGNIPPERESLPSTSKRRKHSKAVSDESNDGYTIDKDLDETRKQINLIKRALTIIYDLERKNFKNFITKRKKKERDVISRVNFIQRIMKNGQAIPLWVDMNEERPPPLCGAVRAPPDYIAAVGDLVAALSGDKQVYLLAEIVAYNALKKIYIVNDIYEPNKTKLYLNRDEVIPLPKMRVDPESCPEGLFQKEDQVLALYPETTCFYAATVSEQPVTSQESYKLLFEEDDFQEKAVHQRYVIPKPLISLIKC